MRPNPHHPHKYSVTFSFQLPKDIYVIENNLNLMYVVEKKKAVTKKKKIFPPYHNIHGVQFLFKCLILREMLLFIAFLLLRFIIGI